MKIGIITFHFAHNQGAVLQCYALQKYLKNAGHEVSIIDYRPAYHWARYARWKNPLILARVNWKRSQGKGVYRQAKAAAVGLVRGAQDTVRGTDREREQIFEAFFARNLQMTRRYKNLKALQKTPPEMDVYITGSDQLWNPDLLDFSLDPAYFLAFGGKNIKRISYAVSLKPQYTERQLQQMKALCANLDHISIREHHAAFEELLSDRVKICVDPTLLLNQEDYTEAEGDCGEEEPFLFVYGFETNAAMEEAVATISAKKGLKVINGSPDRIRLQTRHQKSRDYGPAQFLSYIKKADFVVTNSFHGTALSIVYQKPFVTIAHSTRGARMTELLDKLGISDRIWQSGNSIWEREADMGEMKKKLDGLRKQAIAYLEASLVLRSE